LTQPAKSPAHTFFLSYSRQDVEFTKRLRDDLQERGFSAWLDEQRLAGGERWVESISSAIAGCTALILVVSPDAASSNWVRRETQFALHCSKTIIPVIHRTTSLPQSLEFMIGDVQRLDFSLGDREQNLRQLIASLQALQAATPAAHPKAVDVEVDLPPEVYVEDLQEFFANIPGRLILKLGDAGARELRRQARAEGWDRAELKSALRYGRIFKYLNVLWMRPLPPWAVALTAAVLNVLFYADIASSVAARAGVPVSAAWLYLLTSVEFYMFSIAFIGGVTLVYALFTRWLRRTLMNEIFLRGYKWCVYRPLHASGNVLLASWSRVQPIIWNLLDRPTPEWRKYVDQKVRDPELRRVVELTVIALMNSPDFMRRPRDEQSGNAVSAMSAARQPPA